MRKLERITKLTENRFWAYFHMLGIPLRKTPCNRYYFAPSQFILCMPQLGCGDLWHAQDANRVAPPTASVLKVLSRKTVGALAMNQCAVHGFFTMVHRDHECRKPCRALYCIMAH